MKDALSHIRIDFSEDNFFALNLAIAFIMFGVALGIDTRSFRELARNPKAVLTGVFSQFIVLPALTYLLVLLFNPVPGLALGMILVAACPGGNVSNFFTAVSKGNIALSITLTAIASLLAVVMTPLNFAFWSHLYLGEKITVEVKMETLQMVRMVSLLLVIPMALGIGVSHWLPRLTAKIEKPIRIISFFILMGIIITAFWSNVGLFKKYYHYIIYLVFFHNGIALASGYFLSKKIARNNERDSRTIAIETGIQNSALGLVIIFALFDGNGGMALITAWWGIWHIISGIILSAIFSRGAIFEFQKS